MFDGLFHTILETAPFLALTLKDTQDNFRCYPPVGRFKFSCRSDFYCSNDITVSLLSPPLPQELLPVISSPPGVVTCNPVSGSATPQPYNS